MRHLNGLKLYLNLKENKVLIEKFTKAVLNILQLLPLLHSPRKANDDSGFHSCDEYKAISKCSLINIKHLKDIHQKNLDEIVMII